MQMNLGPRGQAALVIALVAMLGALLGIVGDRALAARAAGAQLAAAPGAPAFPAGRGGPGPMGQGGPWQWEARADMRYAERLAGRLDLTPEQQAAINAIVAEEQAKVRELTREVEPRFRAIAGETRDRIEAVLTDGQRERLREMRDERIRGRPERLGPGGAWGGPRDSASPRLQQRQRP
jgi:Spy/CpxP family protein refolding chaperone